MTCLAYGPLAVTAILLRAEGDIHPEEPLQAGDVPDTTADVSDFARDFGLTPSRPWRQASSAS